jgi:acetyl-CoA carboxylase carboxyltransferase component
MENPEQATAQFVNEFREKFSKPYNPAASGHVDEILVPAETRPRLIAALELLRDKNVCGPDKKHGNMPM